MTSRHTTEQVDEALEDCTRYGEPDDYAHVLAAEVKAMRAAIDHLESEIERAADHLANRGKGGMQVPFHGDFVQAPPSTLIRLRWHVRNIRGGK